MPLYNPTTINPDAIATEWAPNARVADDAIRTIILQGATVFVQAIGTRTTLTPSFSVIEAASWRVTGQESYGAFTALSVRMKGIHILQGGSYYECLNTGTTAATFAADSVNWQVLGGVQEQIFTQVAHGFAINDALYHTGVIWAKGLADAVGTSDIIGIVSRIVDANSFALISEGIITGLSGLTIGENYFLSATVAGLPTATEPTTVGHVSKPLYIADSATTAIVNIMRGAVIGTAATALGWLQANTYVIGAQAIRRGVLIQAVAAIPANTAFAWGTAGATWKPVLDPSYVWRGVWSNLTAYLANAVVSGSAGGADLFITSIGHTNQDPSTNNNPYWSDLFFVDFDNYVGAQSSVGGRRGLVPQPSAAEVDLVLNSSGIPWTSPRLATQLVTDKPIGGDIHSSSSNLPDFKDRYIVTQTTAGQTLTLVAPTFAGVAGRIVWIMSAAASTTSFTMYERTVSPGGILQLFWNGTTWIAVPAITANTVQYVNADTTLSSWNRTVYVSASSNITLPPVANSLGQKITIKRVSSTTGIVVVLGNGGENIDGGSNGTLNLVFNQAVTIEADVAGSYTVSKQEDTGAAVFVGHSQPDASTSRRAIIIGTGVGPFSVLNPALFDSEPFPFVTQFRNSTAAAITFNFGTAWRGKDGLQKSSLVLPAFSYAMMLWSSDLSNSTMNLIVDSSDSGVPTIGLWDANISVKANEIRRYTMHGTTVYLHSLSTRTTGAVLDSPELASWEYVAQSGFGTFTATGSTIVGQTVMNGSLVYESTSNRIATATFDDAEKQFWKILNPPRTEVRTVTANYTAQEWDEVILVDSTAGNVTVTIPVTLSEGKRVTVHKLVAANSMIVASTSMVLTSFAIGTTETFNTQFTNVPYFVASGTVRIFA